MTIPALCARQLGERVVKSAPTSSCFSLPWKSPLLGQPSPWYPEQRCNSVQCLWGKSCHARPAHASLQGGQLKPKGRQRCYSSECIRRRRKPLQWQQWKGASGSPSSQNK
eukprot:1149215-Pelagomonas_calceolata.AAC.5